MKTAVKIGFIGLLIYAIFKAFVVFEKASDTDPNSNPFSFIIVVGFFITLIILITVSFIKKPEKEEPKPMATPKKL
jgi:ABC-type transport system involved in cytochrome c biogenesis permease subunit